MPDGRGRGMSECARSWGLPQGEAEQQFSELNIKQPGMHLLALEETLKAIGEFKRTLIAKGN